MCGGRSSILHYGPLIETNYLYAPTPKKSINLLLVDLKHKTDTVLPNGFKFHVDFSFRFYFDMSFCKQQ